MSIARLTIAALFAVPLLLAGCGQKDETPRPEAALFSAPADYPAFSGDRSFALLERQVAFGPRVPGSDAHAACLAFFIAHFDSLGITVEEQHFSLPVLDDTPTAFTNVIARINPSARRRVLIAAHWDSRPFADMDPDEERRKLPVDGANDGASGVAVILHLAEIFAANPPPVGVDLVLFDAEDLGRDGDESMFCLGSKYYAAVLDAQARPAFGIVLDMVGDRDAVFPREAHSRQYAGSILDMIWGAARNLGLKRFVQAKHPAIIDDHVPLNTVAGIRTVNIIDAALVGHNDPSPRRKYWHTADDTPEQCSPEPLGDVGQLLTYLIYGIQAI